MKNNVAVCLVMALAGWPPAPAAGQTLPAEQHPSLLFTAARIPELKERIQRQPYATWWQTVLERAESIPSSISAERTKARLAKSLAFAYLMTDDVSYAEQAVEILKDMNFPPRGGDLGEPHNEGEVVALYALAYDMIHGFVADDAESLEEIRTILAEEAQRLYDGIVILEIDLIFSTLKIRLHNTPDPRNPSELHLDNWHVRAYGGLGLAALALSDHPGLDESPQDWADRAFDLVTRSLWHQIDEIDGGYAEGPFYSRYAADVYLPYMFALEKRTGVDLLADPRIEKMHEWSLNLRLPNGRRPNIDDGHLDDFYGHYLAAVYADGGVHRWDWENNSRGLYVREFSEMDAIILYDDSVVAQEPEHGPTIFMPEAGDAVFRSDWSAEATYMLLRGEHGRVREQGLAHEHPDETSFIIYAGGEMLALDAGYINFTNHNKVNRGRNHNVILVDGEGPPNTIIAGESIDGGNDAFIEEFFSSDFMDYAEVRASYSGVDIRRRVMFAARDYFVVADELRDDQTHHYEWRLHGHGGGDGGGTYERVGNLARWTQPRAELLAFVPEGTGLIFSERDTLHSFDFRQEPTHTMLRVEQSGDNMEYLTVLYPRSLDQPEPVFSEIAAQGGQAVQIELEGVQDLAWVQTMAADNIAFSGPAGSLDSDGGFGFVRFEGEEVAGFNVQDGSFLNSGGTAVFSASQAVDFSLEITSAAMEGFVRGPDSGYQVSIPVQGLVEDVSFGGTLADRALADGILTLDLAGEGALSLAVDTTPEFTLGDVNEDGRITLVDALFALQASLDKRALSPAQAQAGDVNEDGRITLVDALFILQASLGRRDLGAAPKLIAATRTVEALQSELRGRFEEEAEGQAHLALSVAELAAGALDLKLRYDPAQLTWMGFEPSTSVAGAALVEAHASQPGELRLVRLGLADGEAELGRVIFQWLSREAPAQVEVVGFNHFDLNGLSIPTDITTHFDGRLKALPGTFALHPNMPNPFNPETTIRYDLAVLSRGGAEAMGVRLAIYNMAGQLIRVLVDAAQRPGRYSIEWDGRDAQSREVGSGVYLYRLQAGDQVQVRRMLLLR